jgi:hypothetical protein
MSRRRRGAGTKTIWSSDEFVPRKVRSSENGIDPERKGRAGDRLYRLKFNS